MTSRRYPAVVRPLHALFVALSALALGCGQSGFELSIDLKTDLVPGREMVGVRYELRQGEGYISGDEVLTLGGRDYFEGVRIADVNGLDAGDYLLRVAALGADGSTLQAQTIRVTIREDYGLTALLARECNGTVCAPDEVCFGGACVDDACTPETPEFCGDLCASDADCSGGTTSPCSMMLCLDGACLTRLDDESCEAGAVCTLDGCEGSMPDAGPDGGPDAGPDVLVPVDTGPLLCDPVDCDDDNLCTDDTCDEGFCRHDPNGVSCDDGFFCNGADTCGEGSCSMHEGSPCAMFCNEATGLCEACMNDLDCGAPTVSTFGSCDYDSTCDRSAQRTRTRSTPSCVGGACTVEEQEESEACSRDTTGTRCGATTRTPYGECFFSPCATNGLRMRRRDERLCDGVGSCEVVAFSESEGCVRASQEHAVCGTPNDRCCGGSCINITTNTSNCGGCGLTCEAGESCGSRGGLPSCTCTSGFHGECSAATGSCSNSTRICSCDPAFGGSCPAPMNCYVMGGGADICTY